MERVEHTHVFGFASLFCQQALVCPYKQVTSLLGTSAPHLQKERWCVSPGVVSGLKILHVKGPVLQSMKAVIMDTGPCLGAGSAPLHCTPVSPLPRLRL